MLEVRCSSAERLANELCAQRSLAPPIDQNSELDEELQDINVEQILARARENVLHSRRLHIQGQ